MIDYDAHRWWDHLLDVRGSMVREILYRVLSCVLLAVAVVILDRLHVSVGLPEKAHSLVSVALGLLLVFRTNAAYDRFWEGRKLWGSMVNESRNLARASSVLLSRDPVLKDRLLLLMGLPYAVMNRLRQAGSVTPYTRLPPDQAPEILAAGHIPLAIATRLSDCLNQARERGLLTDYMQMTLDHNVQLLVGYFGACERIHKTPIPFAYVVHLRRALLAYCLTLPFVLIDLFGWWTVLVTLFISYVLFGIEEIGVEISDPFGTDDNDLPLEAICATIEDNVSAYLQKGDPP